MQLCDILVFNGTEYFIPPDEDVWEGFHQQWIETSWQWLKSIGLREDLMAKVHLNHNDYNYYQYYIDYVHAI